jgi:hypothetical protein
MGCIVEPVEDTGGGRHGASLPLSLSVIEENLSPIEARIYH